MVDWNAGMERWNGRMVMSIVPMMGHSCLLQLSIQRTYMVLSKAIKIVHLALSEVKVLAMT